MMMSVSLCTQRGHALSYFAGFVQDSFSGNGSREELVDELRGRAEESCERASLEPIIEAQ